MDRHHLDRKTQWWAVEMLQASRGQRDVGEVLQTNSSVVDFFKKPVMLLNII